MEACGATGLTGVRGRFSHVNIFTVVQLFRNCFSFLSQNPGIPAVKCVITQLAPCVPSKTLQAVEVQLGFRQREDERVGESL